MRGIINTYAEKEKSRQTRVGLAGGSGGEGAGDGLQREPMRTCSQRSGVSIMWQREGEGGTKDRASITEQPKNK